MYRIKFFVLPILLFGTVVAPKITHAQESISNYDVFIHITDSGVVNFQENILYDFGLLQRHGIFREIPFVKTNSDNKKYRIDFDNISVKNETADDATFTSSFESENLILKIGHPDQYVTGKNLYSIRYSASGALTYFSDHDELYWNVLGTDWEVPVNNFGAVVLLPEGISGSDVNFSCFTGYSGSVESACTYRYENGMLKVATTRQLMPNEGVTIVVGFPKGHVQVIEPVKYSAIHPALLVLLVVSGFLLYVFLPLLVLVRNFRDLKRVKRTARIVSAWFDPPKSSEGKAYAPAETALLLKPALTNKHITATIIQLAQKNYLKIIYEDTKGLFSKDKIYLQKLKEPTAELEKFESDLLDAFFVNSAFDGDRVELGALKDNTKFITAINKVKKSLGQSLKKRGDAKRSLDDLNNLVGLLSFPMFVMLNLPLLLVALLVVRKNQQLTEQGIAQYSYAQSLKNFIVTQDAQYDFQAEKQMFFERLLPYATAFGVEDVWIKRFPDLNLSEANWIDGASDLIILNTLTSQMNSTIQTVMTPTRSSSGFSSGFSGGSSGGGGGGGGGGSW